MGNSRSGKPRFNADVAAKIIAHLRVGAYKAHAARAARVSPDALEDWLKLGREGDRRYREFALEVDQVMAEDAIRKQTVITAAALKGHVGDWKAAAWDLERRYPQFYARQAEAAVGVTIGNDTDDNGEPQRTRVEFYIPDNGRRPVEET